MKIKICNTCKTENSPTDIECSECMADISRIRPIEKTENFEEPEPDTTDNPSGATVREVKKTPVRDRLVLEVKSASHNGEILSVNNGDIIGREHVGKDLLAAYNTVGRRHAKIIASGGEWVIEDLDSMNGTYVNGRKLEAGQTYPLKTKDIAALSKS